MVISVGTRELEMCCVSELEVAASDRRRLMTIGYRVMGSGPGPEGIGGGRGRLCGARIWPGSEGDAGAGAGVFALSHFFVCLGRTRRVLCPRRRDCRCKQRCLTEASLLVRQTSTFQSGAERQAHF